MTSTTDYGVKSAKDSDNIPHAEVYTVYGRKGEEEVTCRQATNSAIHRL